MVKLKSTIIIICIFCATTALAAPISAPIVFAFLDNEGVSKINNSKPGYNFSFGVTNVSPDSNSGTTAEAKHILSGNSMALPNWNYQGRPYLFASDISMDSVKDTYPLSPWQITLKNGNDSLVKYTPDRQNAQKMHMVGNLSVTGSGTSPTISWVLPSQGANVTQVRYEIWNLDTGIILTGPVSPQTTTSESLTLENQLQIGTNYEIRIMPTESDSTGTISRSSNWIPYTAKNGSPQGTILNLTTGSPAGVSQTVHTPSNTFYLEFDYRFTTNTGYLDLFLNNTAIGTRLQAPQNILDDFCHAVVEIENPELLSLADKVLLFQLNGFTGSNILIDNIIFPGLINGDFENGFSDWTAVGQGKVSINPIPEPTTILLMGSALICLVGFRKKIIC